MWKRIQVRIPSEQPETIDDLVTALWDAGAKGTEVRDAETWCGLLESPFRPPPRGSTDVIGFFPPDATVALEQLGPGVHCVAQEHFDPDAWMNGWKQFFRPTRVSTRVTVRPSWEEKLPSGTHDVVLVLDPGMAFGTGTHATTRLCIQLMDERLVPTGTAPSLLDVGSGSGILTMTAQKLGAVELLGLDIDPDAVRTAHENWLSNDLPTPAPFATTPLAKISGSWDVVVANMISSRLKPLWKDLVRTCRPGGVLLVSGLLTSERDQFIAEMKGSELTLLEHRTDGEWCAICFEKR